MSNEALVKSLKELTNFDDIINFKRYPIKDLNAPAAQELLKQCRKSVAELGACEMPDFVTQRALDLLQEESRVLETNAFFKPVTGNPYLA